jgi:SAM-dependent methyltransferase
MKHYLRNLFADSSTKSLALDDPALTERRKAILKQKKFLSRIYEEWYQQIIENIPDGPGGVLELGSGAGFLDTLYAGLLKSEVFWLPGNHLVMDGCSIPLANHKLKAIVMTDVLHHIPLPRLFFSEACRCLRRGGVILMIEPWYTSWSGWIYQGLHHELFDIHTESWEFPAAGPLSGANGALPWILFERDWEKFHNEFPELKLEKKIVIMPFRYLVSGGVSMRSLSPLWTYGLWKSFENMLNPWMCHLGMFAFVVLRRA